MKKLFVLLLGALSLASCSNDFDVIADWQEIPVVYGLIDASDTAQYIRVQKAFLDPETSAVQLAGIVDSIYFDAASTSVALEMLNNSGTVVTTIPLNRVDGALEGYPKEGGDFANSPNWLYKTTSPIDANREYRLVINTSSNTYSATTKVVKPFTLDIPNITVSQAIVFNYPNAETAFSWTAPESTNATLFDLDLIITYQEGTLDGSIPTVQKTLTWPMRRNLRRESGNSVVNPRVAGEGFYSFIGDALEPLPNPTNAFRCISGLEVVVSGAAEDLDNFIDIQNTNTGITSAEVVPLYTNIEGGRGVFSSRRIQGFGGFTLAPTNRDSLANGIYTSDLSFQPSSFTCP